MYPTGFSPDTGLPYRDMPREDSARLCPYIAMGGDQYQDNPEQYRNYPDLGASMPSPHQPAINGIVKESLFEDDEVGKREGGVFFQGQFPPDDEPQNYEKFTALPRAASGPRIGIENQSYPPKPPEQYAVSPLPSAYPYQTMSQTQMSYPGQYLPYGFQHYGAWYPHSPTWPMPLLPEEEQFPGNRGKEGNRELDPAELRKNAVGTSFTGAVTQALSLAPARDDDNKDLMPQPRFRDIYYRGMPERGAELIPQPIKPQVSTKEVKRKEKVKAFLEKRQRLRQEGGVQLKKVKRKQKEKNGIGVSKPEAGENAAEKRKYVKKKDKELGKSKGLPICSAPIFSLTKVVGVIESGL